MMTKEDLPPTIYSFDQADFDFFMDTTIALLECLVHPSAKKLEGIVRCRLERRTNWLLEEIIYSEEELERIAAIQASDQQCCLHGSVRSST